MKVKTNVKAGQNQTNNQVAGLINLNIASAFVNSSVG
jgi:hypothetical protein